MLQWQQQAYQSISNKLVEFARKYASYTSSTNLLSSSFFNNAVVTTPNGTFSNLVTASGKTSSNVVLNAVAQLATAARYTVNNSLGASAKDGQITVAGEEIDLGKEIQVRHHERIAHADLWKSEHHPGLRGAGGFFRKRRKAGLG